MLNPHRTRQRVLHLVVGGGLCLLASGMATGAALAYAPENDLLKIKGYSPEVIETASTQRSRQEWKEPAASKHTPAEKFFHNVYYGNWTGEVDAFGSQLIRGQ